MLAIGHQGPILLEDAVDLAGMALMIGRAVPPEKWVDELRLQAEANQMAGFGI